MSFYHSSPFILKKKDLIKNKYLFVSEDLDLVKKEYLFGKQYKFLYKIELYKTKRKTFDILSRKVFKDFREYLNRYYENWGFDFFNDIVIKGAISFTEEENIKDFLIEKGYTDCIFNEIGDLNSGWGQYIKKNYKNTLTIGILDTSIIKSIELLLTRLENEEMFNF